MIQGFEISRLRACFTGTLGRMNAQLSPLTENLGVQVHTALLDENHGLLAFSGQDPHHITAFESTLHSITRYFKMNDGETYLSNDPYIGNTRLCDLMFLRKVSLKEGNSEAEAYVAIQLTLEKLLNCPQIAEAKSVEEEGFKIPPAPFSLQSPLTPHLFEFLAASSISTNDLNYSFRQVESALNVGAADIKALMKTYGTKKYTQSCERHQKNAENAMREVLSILPDGDFDAHGSVDGLRIQIKLSVRGEQCLVSFYGTAKQTERAYNLTASQTLAACFFTLCALSEHPPWIASGSLKAFSVESPEGTLVNARYPGPCLKGYFETADRIISVLRDALSKALHSLNGGQSADTLAPVLVRWNGGAWLATCPTGSGALIKQEGTDAVFTGIHNRADESIEAIESQYPVLITQKSLRDASGGKGNSPGGMGISLGIQFKTAANLIRLHDPHPRRAHGAMGGSSAAPVEIEVTRIAQPTQKTEWDGSVLNMNPGDTIYVNSGGGGGFGKEKGAE